QPLQEPASISRMARLRPSLRRGSRFRLAASSAISGSVFDGGGSVKEDRVRLSSSVRRIANDLDIVPRVGAVERFVAQWKIGNDVTLDHRFQKGPLEPRRIAQMTAGNAARTVQPNPDQDIAAKALHDSEAFGRILAGGHTIDSDRAVRQSGQNLFDQGDALLDFAETNPYPRVHVAILEDRNVEFELIIRSIANGAARIERAARGTADISACA